MGVGRRATAGLRRGEGPVKQRAGTGTIRPEASGGDTLRRLGIRAGIDPDAGSGQRTATGLLHLDENEGRGDPISGARTGTSVTGLRHEEMAPLPARQPVHGAERPPLPTTLQHSAPPVGATGTLEGIASGVR